MVAIRGQMNDSFDRSSSSMRTVDNNGVTLPDLLQALLGVDFVPYLSPLEQTIPCVEKREEESLRESSSLATFPCTLERDDTLDSSLERSESIAVESIFSIDTPPAEYVEQQSAAAVITPPSKSHSKKHTRGKLSSIFKGIKRGVTPKGSSANDHTKQGFHEEKTPKRTGRRDASPPVIVAAEKTPVVVVGDTTACSCCCSVSELLSKLQTHIGDVQREAAVVKRQAAAIERRMSTLHAETARLRQALEGSASELEREAAALQSTKQVLSRLEEEAQAEEETLEASQWSSPLHQSCEAVRHQSVTVDHDGNLETPPIALSTEVSESCLVDVANTAPRRLSQSNKCSSFMRANDLDLDYSSTTSSLSVSMHSLSCPTSPLHKHLSVEELYFLDNNVGLLLESLFQLGYQVATDESNRFQATRETQRILQNFNIGAGKSGAETMRDSVLTWIGSVNHDGVGHDWPVTKARGIVATTPRELLCFLLDSGQVQRYNKMSQGRDDVVVLQEGIDTTAGESEYGFAGTAKIVRALVKPKMLPKTIEMVSLLYAKPLLLEHDDDSYMIVSRSVWEDDSVIPTSSSSSNLIRSEMLLGVQLVRPVAGGCCELTTITHVLSPGVPAAMAKRLAPNNATKMIREIQALFRS